MDLRTGRTYRTKAEALADGVPEADLYELPVGWGTDTPAPMTNLREQISVHKPQVQFGKSPFSSFKNVDPVTR